MSSPTRDIEKESLEAHVELCAARYSRLEEKLDNLEGRVIGIETVLGEIRDTIVKDREKRQTQLITWGVAIIGPLAHAVAVLSYNLSHIKYTSLNPKTDKTILNSSVMLILELFSDENTPINETRMAWGLVIK